MSIYSNGFAGAFPYSDLTIQFALAFETELTFTVPGDSSIKYRAEFSYPYDANVWVGYNITATLPTAGTMTQKNRIELNPIARFIKGGDVLHFISNAIVRNVGVSFLTLKG